MHLAYCKIDTSPILVRTRQAAEVMLYTVDKVNAMQVLPPPLRLGAYLLDDCDKDTYGLQQAVDFIKGKKTVNRVARLG
jgi:metabotropic X receptor